MALTPCSDLSAANWIMADDRPWQQLIGFGPAGFPAYARLRFLPDPVHDGQSESDARIDDDAPPDSARLRIVFDTLARHTRTPDDCYFCLWDGWGVNIEGDDRIAPAFPPAVLRGPKVVLPHRSYFLFRGALSDVGDWGAADLWPGQPRAQMPGAAFVWPADHAWCVADDVDPHWAGIGADVPAIDELLADPRVDVVAADPREAQPFYL